MAGGRHYRNAWNTDGDGPDGDRQIGGRPAAMRPGPRFRKRAPSLAHGQDMIDLHMGWGTAGPAGPGSPRRAGSPGNVTAEAPGAGVYLPIRAGREMPGPARPSAPVIGTGTGMARFATLPEGGRPSGPWIPSRDAAAGCGRPSRGRGGPGVTGSRPGGRLRESGAGRRAPAAA